MGVFFLYGIELTDLCRRLFRFENVFVSGGGSMFPSSDYRYRRSVDVRFGCRNDGFGGDNYIFNKGEEKVPLLKV